MPAQNIQKLMNLEIISQELKDLVSTFDTKWFLGELSNQMKHAGGSIAPDELKGLSSPQRQMYFLAGLLITSDTSNALDCQFSHEKWNKMVKLLVKIEKEYDKLFFPKSEMDITEEWKKVRKVAMPSFLSYFNQGPLNFEEQPISWVNDLYSQLDQLIETETGLKTEHFVQFYENLDSVIQKKFQGFSSPKQRNLFQKEWLELSDIKIGVVDEAPDFIKEMGEQNRPLYTFMADPGVIKRFIAEDLVSANLSLAQVKQILLFLSCQRTQSDYLYYTSTKPGNPLYDKPILNIGKGMYQVFEVKQVIHAIESFLESVCSKTKQNTSKLTEKKGDLLEERILDLFKNYFKSDYKFYRSYYVNGNEQDILFLWKNYAFIIEAKGYNLREPLRDPDKAFVRIKDDFNASIGYGYKQTKRIEQIFKSQQKLVITDKNGAIIEEIDTSQFEDNDFSIIVNLKSFGQIQNDLSTLLEITDEDVFPWAVRLDDLETFILTLIAQKKSPTALIDYLLIREELHGRLICMDESELMGAFLIDKMTKKIIDTSDTLITTPDLADIFDKQYVKGIGFKNEKLLKEKESGKYMFW